LYSFFIRIRRALPPDVFTRQASGGMSLSCHERTFVTLV
jgi:hypothetical protein